MKVALIGASGQAGSRLLSELSSRGHAVTAIARHPEKIAALPGVAAVKGDVYDKAGLVALIKGHDAVISSVHYTASDPALLLQAVRESGVRRYFVVGGAGASKSRRASGWSTRPSSRPPTRPRRARAASSSSFCARPPATSTGPFCRPRRCSLPANGPASSASARTNC